MKIKFIIPLIVISYLMIGCTNDDLPVVMNQKFIVDNTNFMQPFSYEIKAGDITKFPTGYNLKTFLFIYDENEDLILQQKIRSTKYEKVEFALPAKSGKYTLVTITQFSKNGSLLTEDDGPWFIDDEEKFYGISLTCLGGTGLAGITGVLGLDVREVDTSSTLTEDQLTLEMKPITTLLIYWIKDIRKFGDQGAYCLAIDKGTFEIYVNTGFFYAKKFDSPSKYICEIKPTDYKETTTSVYGYYSILPDGKTGFRFDHCTSSSSTPMSNVFYITPKSAEEYLLELDLDNPEQNNEITWSATLVNGASKASVASETEASEDEANAQETVSVMELWNRIHEQ